MKRKRLKQQPDDASEVDAQTHDDDEDEGVVYNLKMGRLDQKLINRVCEHARKGVPLDAICDFLGIPQNDMRTWLTAGERAMRNPTKLTDMQKGQLRLVRGLRSAVAVYRMKLVKQMHSSKWVRALSILERVDRKTYSKRGDTSQVIEATNPDEKYL